MTDTASSDTVNDQDFSWRLIYEEAAKARDQKFSNLELVNEKFNWILVSDLVLFSVIVPLIGSSGSLLVYLAGILDFVAIIYCLLGMQIRGYASGPTHRQMVAELAKGKGYALMLKEISEKIENDISEIENAISSSNRILSISSSLLLVSIVLVLISFILCL
jgi:hypothetical protein